MISDLIFLKVMKLKEAIKAKGIKQTWLAKQIGVSEVTVSNWVKEKSTPKPHHKSKLVQLLDIQFVIK